jgi:hypothetical protein
LKNPQKMAGLTAWKFGLLLLASTSAWADSVDINGLV